ncbi:MAG: hypothetical protein M3R06_02805 [Chloroflexota bacterium]|nr:hypothetical protein [Chloroflexota bacterium]
MKRHLIDPTAIMIGVLIVVGGLIILVGESLLSLFNPDLTQESLGRLELWFALGLALFIILFGGFLASRPRGSLGLLDREVVIGDRPFFDPPLPPVDAAARNGPAGTIEDLAEGYVLYARNGALARVVGMVPGAEEFGRRFSGFIYAQGMYGASDELWIPLEAVMAVYPQSRSAFLAIKGDETEHFGWNRPPASMRRTPQSDPLI